MVDKDPLALPESENPAKLDKLYLSNLWESTTGEGGRLDIIDYVCPKCHKNIFYNLHSMNRCIHCGTPIFSAPRRKMDGEQFRNMQGSYLEELRYDGPERRPKRGAKDLGNTDHKHRTGKATKNKRHLRHSSP